MSFALGLLATLVMPQFGFDDAAFIQRRMPSSIDRERLWVAASIDLVVGASGRIESCTVVGFAGERSLADEVCPILANRKIGKGKGTSGDEIASMLNTVVLAYPDGAQSLVPKMTDLLSQVTGPHYDAIVEVEYEGFGRVIIEVDNQGAVVACQDASGELAAEKIEAICEAASASEHAIYRDKAGAAQSYVRYFSVKFGSDE